jgi:serine/threonine-protein kinase RsbW
VGTDTASTGSIGKDVAALVDGKTNRVCLTLDSVVKSAGTVEETAEAWARQAGFDEDTASNISMVCREAALNAVLHGNKQDPAKHVTATFELTDVELKISIADEGPGLDPDTIPDPSAPENLLRPSGRGVFLMRAYMDEVHFRQLKPGTEIVLVKHRGSKEIRI